MAGATLLVLWVVALAIMVFSPTSDRPNSIVYHWCNLLADAHVRSSARTFGLWEKLFNVLMFVPVGLLGPLFVRLRGWWWWLAIGLVAGATIETVQALFLPQRWPQLGDVLTNALGVLLGYLLGRFWAFRRDRFRSARAL